MAVHQLLVGAVQGDAITREAMTLQRQLRARGVASELYASRIDPRLGDRVRPVAACDAASADTLLVHASIADEPLHRVVSESPARLVLRYHNITPAEWFLPYDPGFARELEEGRAELVRLRDRYDAVIADSTYNAADIGTLGYGDVAVNPIVSDFAAVSRLEPASPEWLPPEGTPVIAFVGRLAPNKGHLLLVQTLHVLQRRLGVDCALVMVGGGETRGYRAAIEALRDDLGVTAVTLAGHVSDEELCALYRRAGVYLSLSGHEGFGVPLVEAMCAGVPVVAWDTAAVGETVAGGGLLLDSRSPSLAAEAVDAVLHDDGVAAALRAAGHARAAALDPAATGDALLRHLGCPPP